jgi:putative radical SAM enzyme (TIGR03279 family)
MGAVVSRVESGSVAARYGFQVNDEIITINRQLVQDIIDYYFLTSEHKLEINFVRNGFPHTTVVHKNVEDPLGLDFKTEVFDNIKQCPYKCMFCFVHQMPKGMRQTLYVKDDDYRLSFLHGSYITLTGLAENDLRRITALRLSPLYVSIHATEPEVRSRMMGSPSAGNILKMLKKLKSHDIEAHVQIVVVPGVNDGKVLKKTLQDLLDLFPTIRSVAIVPVGVTRHRERMNRIRPFKKADAQHVYELVGKFQKKAELRLGFPLFYLADEIYILLEQDFPKYAHYGYFVQLGNGVGLSRKFITEFNRRKRYLPDELNEQRTCWAVTGVLGEKVLTPIFEEFKKTKNLNASIIPVTNELFGETVTVTGLLSGGDIKKALSEKLSTGEKPDVVIIPDLILRDGKFLDDISPEDIEKELNLKIQAVPTTAQGLMEGVTGIISKNVRKDLDLEDEMTQIISDDIELKIPKKPASSKKKVDLESKEEKSRNKPQKHDHRKRK